MKKFLLKSAGFVTFFIAFFIVINALFLALITTASWSVRNRLESIRFDNPDYDLLVLGASTTGDGVDAELLSEHGFKSYNMAIGGSTPETSYVQLEEYLTAYAQKPEYVIFGVNSVMEGDFDTGGIHPIIEFTMKDHKFRIEDIPISKFRWLGFEVFKRLVSKDHRNARLVQGQLRIDKIVPDISSYRDQDLDMKIFESSYWVGETVRLCSENGIELFIVEMPGYKKTQNTSGYGPYAVSYGDELTAYIYNFNSRQIGGAFDPELDWIGNSHLNQQGAAKFTEMLYQALLKDADK